MPQSRHAANQSDITAKATQQRPAATCRTCSYWLGTAARLQAYCAQHGRNTSPAYSCSLHTVL